MNISGIRTSAGFYDYNTIKENDSRRQVPEAMTGKEPRESAGEPGEQSGHGTAADLNLQKTDFRNLDYAKKYQPDAAYELKGADSDINSLDVEKAISDMEKDHALQQYQFFVGECQAEGIVTETRINENFSL